MTSTALETFDLMMARAESAARRMDAAAIATATLEMERWLGELGQALSAAELEHVRSRVGRFRGLCTFVGDTVHEVVTAACDALAKPDRYDDAGRVEAGARAGLLGRYG